MKNINICQKNLTGADFSTNIVREEKVWCVKKSKLSFRLLMCVYMYKKKESKFLARKLKSRKIWKIVVIREDRTIKILG